jgi:hypothetical protein
MRPEKHLQMCIQGGHLFKLARLFEQKCLNFRSGGVKGPQAQIIADNILMLGNSFLSVTVLAQ